MGRAWVSLLPPMEATVADLCDSMSCRVASLTSQTHCVAQLVLLMFESRQSRRVHAILLIYSGLLRHPHQVGVHFLA